jgi:hypothetical protein
MQDLLAALNWEHIGIWVAALLTLAVYSFLYAETPVFRVAEHLFIGVSAAYGLVVFFHLAVKPTVWYPLLALIKQGLDYFHVHYQPAAKAVISALHFSPAEVAQAVNEVPVDFRLYAFIIPFILGVLIFGRFFRGWQWLSRWPIAFSVGFGAGVSIPVAFQANILEQGHQTIEPFVRGSQTWSPAAIDMAGAWALAVGVLTTLAYFYFSAPHRGWLGRSSRLGMWFLMIAFGVGFGNTVMARVALLIGRMQFLLYEWLPLWTGFHRP